MKRVLLVALILILLFGTASADGLFEIGDYNEDVVALHQKLIDLGYYTHDVDTSYSIWTEKALRILQENLDWLVTGKVEDKEQLEEILGLEHVVGKNLLLGTNQGTKNYSISQSGFETELTSPDGIRVKVTITDKAADAGWLTLFYNDTWSRGRLVGPAGDWYTLTFEARSNVEGAEIQVSHKQTNALENQVDFGTSTIGTEWESVSLTGTLTGTVDTWQGLYLDLRGNPVGTVIEIRDLKLEKGSKRTEWVPALED